jgi:serine/threonine protein kinase
VPIDAMATTQHAADAGGRGDFGAGRETPPARVADRYAIESLLGRGGMGEVFAARDARTGARVALKVLRRSHASERGVERLLREARAAGRVQHPGVVRVFDAGVDEINDLAYIAQELLVGETLRALLSRRGRLHHDEAVALMRPVIDALVAAHDAGVVHRDLKPENIFVEAEGDALRPRVIDFGIARLTERDEAAAAQLTTTGAVLGTPGYMSPEQARGLGDVDEQTDVWAIGVVLYELITGTAPLTRATAHATLAAILLDPVPSPRLAAPEVPEVLASVLLRALARNRVERYGSMRELAEALRGATAAAPEERHAERAAPAPTPHPRRRRAPLAAALVAAVGLALITATNLRRAPPPPAQVPTSVAALHPSPAAAPSAPSAVVAARSPAATEGAPRVVAPREFGASRAPLHAPRRAVAQGAPSIEAAIPARRVNGAPIVGL